MLTKWSFTVQLTDLDALECQVCNESTKAYGVVWIPQEDEAPIIVCIPCFLRHYAADMKAALDIADAAVAEAEKRYPNMGTDSQ